MEVHKCPHCGITYAGKTGSIDLLNYGDGAGRDWSVQIRVCVQCKGFEFILIAEGLAPVPGAPGRKRQVLSSSRIWPRSAYRLPAEVPAQYHRDFDEAAAVLGISPRASAALSRRCLQQLLRDQFGKKKDLAAEIDALLDTKPPASVRETVDLIRHFGNFGAHPIVDNAGDLLDVEEGEAETMLAILSEVFDYFFVEPAKRKARLDPLKAKASAGGKLKT